MKNKINVVKYLLLTLYVITALFLCYESLKNGESSSNESGRFISFVNTLPPYKFFAARIFDLDGICRKLFGHFGLYFVLGAFGYWVFRLFIKNSNSYTAVNLLSGLFWAMFTEFLQSLTVGRSASVWDGFVNYGGYLSALAMIISICDNSLFIKEKQLNLALLINAATIITVAAAVNLALIIKIAPIARDQRICYNIFAVIAIISSIIIAAINRLKRHIIS